MSEMPIGEIVVMRIDDGPVVLRADDRIAVADEFMVALQEGTLEGVAIHRDGALIFCDDFRYLPTGERLDDRADVYVRVDEAGARRTGDES